MRAMPFFDFVSIKASHGTKNYAVGLEMSCPGGAYHWAPEIPSTQTIAGARPGKCELAHNRGAFFPQLRGLRSRARNLRLTVRRRAGLIDIIDPQCWWNDLPWLLRMLIGRPRRSLRQRCR